MHAKIIAFRMLTIMTTILTKGRDCSLPSLLLTTTTKTQRLPYAAKTKAPQQLVNT